MTTEEKGAVSLVERVLVTTRERILNGTYAPGSRLRLHKIAEEAGVSLIPAREALRVLEAERLVVTVPNKGARVAELSLEDMRDLYAVRSTLEAEAVRTARQLSEDEADHLRSLLDEIQAAFAAGDEAKVMRIHRQFHFGLYERSDSAWLPYLADILWKHTQRYQWLSFPYRHDGADAEHRSVVAALERGDNESAAAALQDHLHTTAVLLESAYAEAPELQPELQVVDA